MYEGTQRQQASRPFWHSWLPQWLENWTENKSAFKLRSDTDLLQPGQMVGTKN
jgi:hypothetical protein